MKIKIKTLTPTFILSGTIANKELLKTKGKQLEVLKIKPDIFSKLTKEEIINLLNNFSFERFIEIANSNNAIYPKIKAKLHLQEQRFYRFLLEPFLEEFQGQIFPIIPGSSLKGALTMKIKLVSNEYNRLSDNIIITDFLPENNDILGVYLIKNFGLKRRSKIPIEAIGIESNSIFNGEISLYSHEDDEDIRRLLEMYNSSNEKELIKNIIKETHRIQFSQFNNIPYELKKMINLSEYNEDTIFIGRWTTELTKCGYNKYNKKFEFSRNIKHKKSINLVVEDGNFVLPGIIKVDVV